MRNLVPIYPLYMYLLDQNLLYVSNLPSPLLLVDTHLTLLRLQQWPFYSTKVPTLHARWLLLPHLGSNKTHQAAATCSAHMDTFLILLRLQAPWARLLSSFYCLDIDTLLTLLGFSSLYLPVQVFISTEVLMIFCHYCLLEIYFLYFSQLCQQSAINLKYCLR